MAMAEISFVPLGTNTPLVSQCVARAIKVLEKEKDARYEMTAMGKIMEGDLDRVLAEVKKMHEGIFWARVARVLTVRIDDRPDKAQGAKENLDSLKRKLWHQVNDALAFFV